MTSTLYTFLTFFIFFGILSVPSTIQAQELPYKGLYINDFKNIIGDETAETELLTFAQANGFNYLLLYNLYHIHTQKFPITDSISAQPLADFMIRARETYGVTMIGGVGETAASFDRMVAFNSLYSHPAAKLDIFNMEYEFWNRNMIDRYYCNTYLQKNNLPCDTSGAFQHYIQQLSDAKTKAGSAGALMEVYIGKPTQGQCRQIGILCDRVLVHYYRPTPTYNDGSSIYRYHSYRLEALAPLQDTLQIMPIFAGGPNFMGNWLSSNDHTTVMDIYLNGQNGFAEQTGAWKDHIQIVGQQWYQSTYMMENIGMPETPLAMVLPSNQNPATPRHVNRRLRLRKPRQQYAKLTMLDISGTVVATAENTKDQHIKIDTRDIADGVYFLMLETGGETKNYRIVVQH